MDYIRRLLPSKKQGEPPPEVVQELKIERYEQTFSRKPYAPYDDRDPRYYGRCLYDMQSRMYWVIAVTCIVGIAIPAIVLFATNTHDGVDNYGNCLVDSKYRFQCDFNQVEDLYQSIDNCSAGRSCWETSQATDNFQFRCYHSVPSGYQYYLKDNAERCNRSGGNCSRMSGNGRNAIDLGQVVKMEIRPAKNDYEDREILSNSMAELYWENADVLSLDFYHPDRISKTFRRPMIDPRNQTDFEPEISFSEGAGDFFYIQIDRKLGDGGHQTIFDTRLGPMRFSQGNVTVISTFLPSRHFYGIKGGQGETEGALTVDGVTTFGQNELPFYMVHENQSDSMHALLIETSRPFVAQVINGPGISFHFEGDFGPESDISLKIFLGPKPEDVLRQLAEYMQSKTSRTLSLPPYWSLGLHLCRKTTSADATLADILRLNREGSDSDPLPPIPYDSDCISENLRNPFKIDGIFSNISAIVDKLSETSKRVLLSQRIAVSSSVALEVSKENPNFFVLTHSMDTPFMAVIGNETVAYPSIFDQTSKDWISKEFEAPELLQFSGLVLTDNLLRHDNASYEQLMNPGPHRNSRILTNFSGVPYGTLNPLAIHANTSLEMGPHVLHRDVNNIYGHEVLKLFSEIAANNADDTSGRMVVSGDTLSPESFVYGGYNGLSVKFSWDGLRESLGHFVRYFMFNPYGGIPIGGSWIDLADDVMIDQELCLRWYQAAILLPFARSTYGDLNRNHSRGPLDLNRVYQRHLIQNINDRYALNPYYYTLFWNYIKDNGIPPVVPVSFYSVSMDTDMAFKSLDQFMIGPAVMAAPVVYPGTSRSVYFPAGRWYTLDGEVVYDNENKGSMITVSALINHVPLFLKHGHVLPMLLNPDGESAEEARGGQYVILCSYPSLDDTETFTGKLYIDDGISMETTDYEVVNFSLTRTELQISVEGTFTSPEVDISKVISQIRIFGAPRRPKAIQIQSSVTNGTLPSKTVTLDEGVLKIEELDLTWDKSPVVTLSWDNLWE